VDIEIGIGEGAKARKKVAILSSVAAWTRKKTSSCSNLSFFLSSLSPPPPRQQQAGKFTTIKDAQDGYEFAYPFGWQEVT
jgi:hypothetical protein